MHFAEIFILIIGALLFTVSFFIPDKGTGSVGLDEEEERKIIRDLLDKEIDEAKDKIEEAAQECVYDNRDKMERALDRITNEKMSAVDEYSNTVLEQIHKNHDEVVFLYDMLNNKHTQVKNTAAELNQITKSAKMAAENASRQTEQVATANQITTASQASTAGQVASASQTAKTANASSNRPASAAPVAPVLSAPYKNKNNDSASKPAAVAGEEKLEDGSIFEELPVKKVDLEFLDLSKADDAVKEKNAKAKAAKGKTEKTPVADGNIDLMFASDNNSANSNDKILALHKEGKSNMAIAKELGLGIGEVKLVIDLFEGI